MASEAEMPNLIRTMYWAMREATRDALKARIVDPARSCIVRGKELRIGFSNPLEGYRISTYESKEPETLDWFDKALRDNDVVFDIGANIGLYSIYAAKTKSKAQIYSFEPEAQNFTRLQRNILLNELKNIVPVNVALASGTAFGYLHVSELIASSALHSFSTSQLGTQAKFKQGIMGISLDDLVLKYGLAQPSLVKIDVDGIEEGIVEGGKRVLSNPACRELLIEINAKQPESSNLYRTIESFGFHCVAKSDWVARSTEGEARNFIFAKNAKKSI